VVTLYIATDIHTKLQPDRYLSQNFTQKTATFWTGMEDERWLKDQTVVFAIMNKKNEIGRPKTFI